MTDRNNIWFYYDNDKDTEKAFEKLGNIAEEHGFRVVEESKDANIIIGIGGDGTFLQAVRLSGFKNDALYAGITRKGQPSLYCDFYLENFDQLLQSTLQEDLKVRRFPTICVTVNDGTPFYCINELTIRSTIVKTIVIQISIDGKIFETFRGDGLVVATPTGSTAYNKSANGAVVDPLLSSFQVSEINSMNNNKYRTLGSSFILNNSRKLHLEIIHDGNDHPIISFDNEAHPIKKIRHLDVWMDDVEIKTIRLKNNSYWDRVKRMFL